MKRRIVADERRFIYASENYALENMHWKTCIGKHALEKQAHEGNKNALNCTEC